MTATLREFFDCLTDGLYATDWCDQAIAIMNHDTFCDSDGNVYPSEIEGVRVGNTFQTSLGLFELSASNSEGEVQELYVALSLNDSLLFEANATY